MERVNCLLCGSDNEELLFVGYDRMHGVAGRFNVVKCRTCSLVYLNPRPTWDEMKRFYPIDYGGHGFREAAPLRKMVRIIGYLRKRRLVERQKPKGILLDIGCGSGEFLAVMAASGNWQIFGVEPDIDAARYAVQIPGAEIFCGKLEEAEYPSDFFDVITMWHVLEHLYNPLNALEKIWHILKPDGLLVLAVPILDSFDARLFGPYWAGYDVPRHIVTFSKSTLTKMLNASGFSSVRFEAYIGGHDAFCISLSYWASERLRPALLKMIRSVSQSLGIRLLMSPYYTFLNIIGRGSTAVITARPVKCSARL